MLELSHETHEALDVYSINSIAAIGLYCPVHSKTSNLWYFCDITATSFL